MSERVTVKITLSRDNMEFLRDMIAMYQESEEPLFRRVATTAHNRIEAALAALSAALARNPAQEGGK